VAISLDYGHAHQTDQTIVGCREIISSCRTTIVHQRDAGALAPDGEYSGGYGFSGAS